MDNPFDDPKVYNFLDKLNNKKEWKYNFYSSLVSYAIGNNFLLFKSGGDIVRHILF